MMYDQLSVDERAAINEGRWFASLLPEVRHDLLRLSVVRRYAHGDCISTRGNERVEWYACAKGVVRIASDGANGKPLALTYIKPGIWFGDPGLFDGGRSTHDAHAFGETAVLVMGRAELLALLEAHPSLAMAVLRLQARHVRQLYDTLEEANTMTLRPRLAKQLMALARTHGVPVGGRECATRISLRIPQAQIAQLVGSSRQRVNAELKEMERSGYIRIDTAGLVVCNAEALVAQSQMRT